MEKRVKHRSIWALAAVCVLIAALLILLYVGNQKPPVEGEKSLSLCVMHADGTTAEFALTTSEAYLRGALEQAGLIAGNQSELGLYVLTVNGETADEAKQQWWCLTKGGEDVMTGVDTTPIQDADRFELTLKTGW